MYKVCFSCHSLPFLYLSSDVLLYLPLIKTTLILNERLVYEWQVQQHMRRQHKILVDCFCPVWFDLCTKYVLIYVRSMYWFMYKVCFDLCTKFVLFYVQSVFWFMYKVCFALCLKYVLFKECFNALYCRYMRPCSQEFRCGLLSFPSRWMCRNWCPFQQQCLRLNSSIQWSAWFGYLQSVPCLPIWTTWPLNRGLITGSSKIS